jgi:ATP-dependent DNA ligase
LPSFLPIARTLDGELCGVLPDGRTAFNIVQNAADRSSSGSLAFFLFDLLFLDGEDLRPLPLVERKERLKALLADAPSCLQYTDHQIGRGPAFHRLACEHGLEGIVSKRVNAPYEPGRRVWLKVKCLNREEFIVVGWSDPEGTRHRLGSLLLGYYTPDGKLIYAGRAGTGMTDKELERLWRKLQPLALDKMPLAEVPPRGQSIWDIAGVVAIALGQARNGGRGELFDVDRGRPAAPRRLYR